MDKVDLSRKYTKEETVAINNKFKESYMENIAEEINKSKEREARSEERFNNLADRIEKGFDSIGKILEKQGDDIGCLKIWRAGVVGGLAVITIIGGFFTTFYFAERTRQEDINKTVVQLETIISKTN